MSDFLEMYRLDCRNLADAAHQEALLTYFKTPILAYGLRSTVRKEIEKKWRPVLKAMHESELWMVSTSLFASQILEEQLTACFCLELHLKKMTAEDFFRVSDWMEQWVHNWAVCDQFSTHIVGYLITRFPELLPAFQTWKQSESIWKRRAVPVSMIYPVKKSMYIEESLVMTESLISDQEDMVQKGLGWLLKEISQQDPERIYRYLKLWEKELSRTTLRIALEKYPQEIRAQFIKRTVKKTKSE